MRQLVGSLCVFCQQRIGSIVEGAFCTDCDCPSHRSCRQIDPSQQGEGDCPTCGAKAQVWVEERKRQHEQIATSARELRQYRGFQTLFLGFLWLVGGGAASLFCFGMSAAGGGGGYVVFTGAILFGLAMIIIGIVQILRG